MTGGKSHGNGQGAEERKVLKWNPKKYYVKGKTELIQYLSVHIVQ
jgi:hypothetical protein